ncbi:MAG: hypD [Firmicutes bacterium]|nr:hypD [Bacillota bacterium]
MMSNNVGVSEQQFLELVLKAISETADKQLRIMEVCGTHTMAIARSGMKQVLPNTITLLSGPGCPVCVTDVSDIDDACILAGRSDVILASYGDMLRVPGTSGSLTTARISGADIRVIYSSFDALRLAIDNPQREVILYGVGFETTAPTSAVAIEAAIRADIGNFSVLSVHKAVPPILRFLLSDRDLSIDAFLLPGHVCTIAGTCDFDFIAEEYLRPCVVAGFEPVDILEAILMVIKQYQENMPTVEVQYRRAVKARGNTVGRQYITRYFNLADCVWRGIGLVPASGFKIRDEYSKWDARAKFNVSPPRVVAAGCVCGDILKGKKQPPECEYYGVNCTPANPQGPCMVSEEGSCAAFYRYSCLGG